MTGQPRKPQVPDGKRTTQVRTTSDWQDGTPPWMILRGASSKYQSEPTKRQEPPCCGPTIAKE